MGGCPNCSAENPAGSRFCTACGSSLSEVQRCAACGTSLPAEARFCSSCGVPVATPIDEPEMLKLVTVMFLDVVGSTSQAESMSPEETRALMADFFQAMTEEILAEGGTVERVIGDAIMADFGVPIAREDDPERAVRAGLRMLARLERWNEGRAPERQVKIRIGINTGEVSTGGSYGEQLMVMGDAVNVAARLEQAAEPGSILIGARTASLVAERFVLREVGELELKGKSGSIVAFAVEAERPSIPKVERAPLIGRERDLEALRDAYERTKRTSSPIVALVAGEPGVGKTRLAQEFVRGLANEAEVLEGRCYPGDQTTSLLPFREIFASLRERLDSGSTESAGLSLGLLDDALGTRPENGAITDVDPREMHHRFLLSWDRMLEDLAAARPLVVIVEDLHWSDAASRDLLRALSLQLRGPVLFLCLARPDDPTLQAWFGGVGDGIVLRMEPLGREASDLLLHELVRGAELPAALAEEMYLKSTGNPFFLEEMVNRLADLGHLIGQAGAWRFVGTPADIEVPDSIRLAIVARLDLLSASERAVAQRASVIGRTFSAVTLAHLFDAALIAPALETLVHRQFVVEGPGEHLERRFSFRHALIREVCYESLPRSERGKAHAAAADWFREERPTNPSDVVEILAHHYDSAFRHLGEERLRLEARRYCFLAARNAVGRFAIAEAEALGRRAVELSNSGPERLEALESLGDTYMLTNNGDGAWAAYRDAMDQHSPMADAWIRLAAKAAILATRFEPTMDDPPRETEVVELVEKALAACEDDSPEQVQLLVASSMLPSRFAPSEHPAAEKDARQALEIAERLGVAELESAALDAVGLALLPELRYSALLDLHRRRVDLVPSIRDVGEICDVYGSAAYGAVFAGAYSDAIQWAGACLERSRGLDPGHHLHALIWRAEARFRGGDWDGALADVAEIEGLEGTDPIEAPTTLAMRAYAVAALCHELRGQREASERYLEWLRRYREVTASSGPSFAGPLPLAARALAYRGEPDAARSFIVLERHPYLAAHLEAAGEIARVAGDAGTMKEILTRTRAEIPAGELPLLDAYVDRLSGHFSLERGRDDEGIGLLAGSAERFAALGAPWEEATSCLLQAEACAAAGKEGEAAEPARLALPIFRRLGSVQEVARAEALVL